MSFEDMHFSNEYAIVPSKLGSYMQVTHQTWLVISSKTHWSLVRNSRNSSTNVDWIMVILLSL